ncbi:hypothetical protein BWQ96_01434 [Gracilariopsis chorda]|uniref:Uncharacterized protein n=1 Tax=Gracilariopsis chorda TaxID=448386 RepID=A0A2V3J393_9FLOR|nr:hypothetical protein BWQ96_01434 [Gracilariopsis chorda]|eukprot:PXF48878.1 hypothetical protein BWQ96_01434 [Gracilariopsis chorda]
MAANDSAPAPPLHEDEPSPNLPQTLSFINNVQNAVATIEQRLVHTPSAHPPPPQRNEYPAPPDNTREHMYAATIKHLDKPVLSTDLHIAPNNVSADHTTTNTRLSVDGSLSEQSTFSIEEAVSVTSDYQVSTITGSPLPRIHGSSTRSIADIVQHFESTLQAQHSVRDNQLHPANAPIAPIVDRLDTGNTSHSTPRDNAHFEQNARSSIASIVKQFQHAKQPTESNSNTKTTRSSVSFSPSADNDNSPSKDTNTQQKNVREQAKQSDVPNDLESIERGSVGKRIASFNSQSAKSDTKDDEEETNDGDLSSVGAIADPSEFEFLHEETEGITQRTGSPSSINNIPERHHVEATTPPAAVSMSMGASVTPYVEKPAEVIGQATPDIQSSAKVPFEGSTVDVDALSKSLQVDAEALEVTEESVARAIQTLDSFSEAAGIEPQRSEIMDPQAVQESDISGVNESKNVSVPTDAPSEISDQEKSVPMINTNSETPEPTVNHDTARDASVPAVQTSNEMTESQPRTVIEKTSAETEPSARPFTDTSTPVSNEKGSDLSVESGPVEATKAHSSQENRMIPTADSALMRDGHVRDSEQPQGVHVSMERETRESAPIPRYEATVSSSQTLSEQVPVEVKDSPAVENESANVQPHVQSNDSFATGESDVRSSIRSALEKSDEDSKQPSTGLASRSSRARMAAEKLGNPATSTEFHATDSQKSCSDRGVEKVDDTRLSEKTISLSTNEAEVLIAPGSADSGSIDLDQGSVGSSPKLKSKKSPPMRSVAHTSTAGAKKERTVSELRSTTRSRASGSRTPMAQSPRTRPLSARLPQGRAPSSGTTTPLSRSAATSPKGLSPLSRAGPSSLQLHGRRGGVANSATSRSLANDRKPVKLPRVAELLTARSRDRTSAPPAGRIPRGSTFSGTPPRSSVSPGQSTASRRMGTSSSPVTPNNRPRSSPQGMADVTPLQAPLRRTMSFNNNRRATLSPSSLRGGAASSRLHEMRGLPGGAGSRRATLSETRRPPRHRVTIPEPFQLTGAELQAKALKQLEEQRRRREEMERRRRVFKARPMPDFSNPMPRPNF